MERIVCLGPPLRVTKPDRIARAVRTDRIRARRCRLQLPRSQHQQQLITAPVLQPITDLLVDPMRRRRPRRQRHHEKPRAVQRLGDAAPQIRAGRQIGVIAKHPQRPQLTQPAPDTVQTLLNPRNHRPITMRIRQKRVIVQRLHLSRRRGLRGLRYLRHRSPSDESGFVSTSIPQTRLRRGRIMPDPQTRRRSPCLSATTSPSHPTPPPWTSVDRSRS
jgi:hypothetical protein